MFLSLTGNTVDLFPMKFEHYDAIVEALRPMPDLVWDYLPQRLSNSESIRHWMETHLREMGEGRRFPYVIVDKHSKTVVGSSSFLGFDGKNRSIEIGWTWVSPRFWGSKVNPECKLLLLNHAFSALECVRVQFKTDEKNVRSKKALEKIGAKYEGTLRKHLVVSTGRWRDSAFYSVINDDWPEVRAKIQKMLE